MIYMEPVSLGWECLVHSWINLIASGIDIVYKLMLQSIIIRFTRAILYLIRRCNLTVLNIDKGVSF